MHTFCSGRSSDSLEFYHTFVCAGNLWSKLSARRKEIKKNQGTEEETNVKAIFF